MRLKDVNTIQDLEMYGRWLDKQEIEGLLSNDENYDLYNVAYNQVFECPAFDENGNFFECD